LPKAAEHFRRQVEQGLDGDPRAALKARVILRELLGGRIDLRPKAMATSCGPSTACSRQRC